MNQKREYLQQELEKSNKPMPHDSMQAEELNERIADASKTIFSYCMAKTNNPVDAEDLCQDILLELVRSSGNIRDCRAFYGFMWAVAGNVYKQWCRKKSRFQTCELMEDVASEESVLDKALACEENNDLYLLRRELSLLSEKYRQAVVLYYIDQKSCSQIAEILSISESRVKYLLFKSRKILKDGMRMERKLGALSVNPKYFVPLYHGTGPNHFWDFMQSKVRQNIVAACYPDGLTPECISLETGIPLPYLDSEISSLTERAILIKEGGHYRANIIILTEECADKIMENAAPYHQKIAGLMAEFLETKLPAFRQIGFTGSDFTDNTLRWQMVTFYLRESAILNIEEENAPLTAWGDRAYLWLAEQGNALNNNCLRFCTVNSRRGDLIHFIDYLPAPKSNHYDFYGKEHKINVLCDIARKDYVNLGKYDLEAAANLIRKEYVRKEQDTCTVTMPVFTQEQYTAACSLVKDFATEKLEGMIGEMDRLSAHIISRYTPRHLKSQIPGVALAARTVNAGSVPLNILVEKGILSTDWNPGEMPTMQIRLNR